MKKKNLFFTAMPLLVLVIGLSTWIFIRGVNNQIWMNSMQNIVESTRQSANALNIQFETDFTTLRRLWEQVRSSDSPEAVPELYGAVEPGVTLYVPGQSARDPFLEEALGEDERGALDIHGADGREVFGIYVKGALADGTPGYLVKEYPPDEIVRQFTLSFYDGAGFSYLVNSNGGILVRPEGRNRTEPNLFDMLPEERKRDPDVRQFQESVRQSQTGWARLRGTGMVLCCEPLSTDLDWLLVSVIPDQVITSQTGRIVVRSVLFAAVAVITLLLVMAVFFWNKMCESESHTRALAKALVEMDNANRVKSRFLMDMSHDIRTPLNAIVGMTAVARENLGDRKRLDDCLQKIRSSSTVLLSLVSDVLDLSQIEQGKMILREEPVRLVKLFEELAEAVARKAGEAGLNFSVEPVRLRDGTVTGDVLRMEQILFNICRNAVQYTPAGGRVTLELVQTEDKDGEGFAVYRFRCADTGIGMSPELIKRIYLPFERARNTTVSRIAGAGVGLSITKSLLDLMGGSISVESEVGKGSTFTVLFRLKVCQPLPEPEEAAAPPEEILDYRGRRVLLVEDNELNMEILEELLSLTGIQIEKAYDGQQAVQMVEGHPEGYYDMILMDIQMPIMDGYEATRRIRKMGAVLPIYAVSANALASDVENALSAGMNGHIAKPVELDTLERALKESLK